MLVVICVDDNIIIVVIIIGVEIVVARRKKEGGRGSLRDKLSEGGVVSEEAQSRVHVAAGSIAVSDFEERAL